MSWSHRKSMHYLQPPPSNRSDMDHHHQAMDRSAMDRSATDRPAHVRTSSRHLGAFGRTSVCGRLRCRGPMARKSRADEMMGEKQNEKKIGCGSAPPLLLALRWLPLVAARDWMAGEEGFMCGGTDASGVVRGDLGGCLDREAVWTREKSSYISCIYSIIRFL